MVEVTQADREAFLNLVCAELDSVSDPVWKVGRRLVAEARHRDEATRPLVEALEGIIHEAEWMADKVDMNDAAREGVKGRIARAKEALAQHTGAQ